MESQTDGDRCYSCLIKNEDKFREKLVDLVLTNFYPPDSKIEEKDNLCFIVFETKNIKPEDKKKMLYSESSLKWAIELDCIISGKNGVHKDLISLDTLNLPPHYSFSLESDLVVLEIKGKD